MMHQKGELMPVFGALFRVVSVVVKLAVNEKKCVKATGWFFFQQENRVEYAPFRFR